MRSWASAAAAAMRLEPGGVDAVGGDRGPPSAAWPALAVEAVAGEQPAERRPRRAPASRSGVEPIAPGGKRSPRRGEVEAVPRGVAAAMPSRRPPCRSAPAASGTTSTRRAPASKPMASIQVRTRASCPASQRVEPALRHGERAGRRERRLGRRSVLASARLRSCGGEPSRFARARKGRQSRAAQASPIARTAASPSRSHPAERRRERRRRRPPPPSAPTSRATRAIPESPTAPAIGTIWLQQPWRPPRKSPRRRSRCRPPCSRSSISSSARPNRRSRRGLAHVPDQRVRCAA